VLTNVHVDLGTFFVASDACARSYKAILVNTGNRKFNRDAYTKTI